jgi:hypothetical protein
VTFNYSDIYTLKSDELIRLLGDTSKQVKSLRVKIDKDDPIDDERLHALLTISFNIPNLSIDKKSQMNLDENITSVERQKELEERKNEIAKYDKLSFEEITIKYAKEKFNATISEVNIKEALTN